MFSNTFAGIAPSSVPNFISAQVVGGALAFGLIKGLYPGMTEAEAADVIEPHLRGESDLEYLLMFSTLGTRKDVACIS